MSEIEQVPNFPSTVNRNVIQSYIFSAMRARLSIYQMRIIYRLVDFAQSEIDGILIKDNMTRITHSLRHVDLSMSVRSVMPGKLSHPQMPVLLLTMQFSVIISGRRP